MGQAVFRLDRVADDGISGAPRAGIVTEGDQLRKLRNFGHQADIVQVEDAPAVAGRLQELLRRGVVGGEHDLLAARTDPAAELKLGDRAAVESEAHFPHDRKDAGVWQSLHGEVLPKTVYTREGPGKGMARLADPRLVVDMKWGAVMGGDLRDHRVEAVFELR